MIWIVAGAIAFILLTVFDFNKLNHIHPLLNAFFALGVLLLVISAGGVLLAYQDWGHFNDIPLFWLFAVAGALEMIYALFFALEFKKTYVSADNEQLVDTGLYALCRHPGVWGFAILAFSLGMALGSPIVLSTAFVWTLLDILRVYIQDNWFFMRTIPGYAEYKQRTPFLLFGVKELRKCVESF